ncbi:hypothetical protein ELI00_19570 [Rhizobium ruizarguesonis]|uniref:hypothetical protein n=1 Tax=Rhizobium ruizarguesonis TaxID=2081791 RepID=UPI0010315C13|nr:hypothetical protein [Rhizobium ruizarguesonis]TAU50003.1 hypothetical protein ELI42_19125 [Rhizobium ruizarguesonis]TAU65074.1 hypothetical protein ELI44_19145 [Rhizobium ruizarguesonis]TAX78270.1 hypothetical protein ELI00_19570 [Rhizobium ruizarguesonis]
MISEAHARSVIAGLKNLKSKGVQADWIDGKIVEYERLLTRAYLLNGQPDPFVPYRDKDGLMVLNELGDRENDI